MFIKFNCQRTKRLLLIKKMVGARGFEPLPRSSPLLMGYKPTALPLSYAPKFFDTLIIYYKKLELC